MAQLIGTWHLGGTVSRGILLAFFSEALGVCPGNPTRPPYTRDYLYHRRSGYQRDPVHRHVKVVRLEIWERLNMRRHMARIQRHT